MTQYICILRGINVSGQKKIKMADLKALFQGLGFSNVASYIQSGNVIFNSDIDDTKALQLEIEQAIQAQYTFDVPAIIRTSTQFKVMLKGLPFDNIDISKDGAQVLMTILAEQPTQQRIADIQQYVKSPERLVILDNTVYIHCPNGYGNSKLSNVFVEKKLGVAATTRNLKTINKLCEIASE